MLSCLPGMSRYNKHVHSELHQRFILVPKVKVPSCENINAISNFWLLVAEACKLHAEEHFGNYVSCASALLLCVNESDALTLELPEFYNY